MPLLDRLDALTRGAARRGAVVPAQDDGQDVGRRLRELLDAADVQDAEAGRRAWLARAVEHLVPDEARILAVLAEQRPGGPGRALVHIHCLTATGLAGEPLLENHADVGRHCRLALPQLIPYYVGRLVALDLVEVGPEDQRLDDEYPRLLAEPHVLAALAAARAQGLTPRVMRHSLTLSGLGHELWRTVAGPAQA